MCFNLHPNQSPQAAINCFTVARMGKVVISLTQFVHHKLCNVPSLDYASARFTALPRENCT